MKRWRITPKAQTLPFDPSRGMDYKMVAEALIREDEDGGWVHYDEAAEAVKKATENAGTVTLRQRYKLAALGGLVREGMVHNAIPQLANAVGSDADFHASLVAGIVKATAIIADAMLAEDEEYAKK